MGLLLLLKTLSPTSTPSQKTVKEMRPWPDHSLVSCWRKKNSSVLFGWFRSPILWTHSWCFLGNHPGIPNRLCRFWLRNTTPTSRVRFSLFLSEQFPSMKFVPGTLRATPVPLLGFRSAYFISLAGFVWLSPSSQWRSVSSTIQKPVASNPENRWRMHQKPYEATHYTWGKHIYDMHGNCMFQWDRLLRAFTVLSMSAQSPSYLQSLFYYIHINGNVLIILIVKLEKAPQLSFFSKFIDKTAVCITNSLTMNAWALQIRHES